MKILIADDDSSSRKLLGFLVTKCGYEVVSVRTGLEAKKVLAGDPEICIALLHMRLPDMSGVEVCREFQEDPEHRFIYFIITSSNSFQENDYQALDQGAHDIVYKPYQKNYIQARLDVGRRLIQTNNRLATLALVDQLTGLCNRRSFLAECHRQYDYARRHRLPTTLLYFDLDNLKNINDSYGHQTGDHCIKLLAQKIKQTFNGNSLSGRLGGDEFAVLLTEKNHQDAYEFIKDFKSSIQGLAIPAEDGSILPLQLTVSIGISVSRLGEFRLDELIKQADSAVLKAKKEGKNCIAEWEPDKKEACLLI